MAEEPLPKYLLGKTVVVTDDGQLYSSYEDMATKFKFTNWGHDRGIKNGVVCKVINMAPHSDDRNEIVLGVAIKEKQYLIGLTGVELIETEEQIIKSPEYFNIANLIK